LDIGYEFVDMPRDPFNKSETGLEEVPFGTWDWPIPYSSAEEIQNAELMLEGAA